MMLARSLGTPSASPNLKIVVMMIFRSSARATAAAGGLYQIGRVGSIEGARYLRIEVDAVDNDHHGGVL